MMDDDEREVVALFPAPAARTRAVVTLMSYSYRVLTRFASKRIAPLVMLNRASLKLVPARS